MDNLKISHVDKGVVTDFCDNMVKLYKKYYHTQGGGFDCLGQHLYCESIPASLMVSMIPYAKMLCKEWPEKLNQGLFRN